MALSFNGKEVNKICFNNNVGYKVVGNPTINDGVVSGFSTNDYLSLPQPDLSGPFEMFFKFTTPSTWGTAYDIVFSTSGVTFQKQGPNRYLAYYLVGTGESSHTQYNGSHTRLQENTTYYVKIVYDGAAITAYISTDGNTWETDMTVNYASGFTSSICVFGRSRRLAQQFWNGSIDLNETYIKVNGVTWFSGKEQASKDVNYVIKDGKLVWTNPNLWLQGDGASYIDTGIIGNGETTTFEFAYLSPTDNQALFGARQTASSRNLGLVCVTGDGRFDYQNANQFYDILFPVNTKNIIKSKIESRNYTIERYDTNGVLQNTKSVALQSFTTPYNLALFARNNNGTVDGYSTAAKIYYFKIYTNGVLTKHFVPISKGLVIGNYTVPSNGMWDIVSQQFFGNSGTGEFSYGKDE